MKSGIQRKHLLMNTKSHSRSKNVGEVADTILAMPRCGINQKLYEPVISLFIAELDRRFSKESSSVLIAMSALVPTSKDFLSIQVFSSFANHYGLNEELLKCEFTVFSNQYWKKNPQLNTMLDVINFIEPHKVVYIELYKAYQIACAIPVTTAET